MTDKLRFEKVRTVRAFERIVEQIEAHIASGNLKPGDRLPSERQLTTQFGVGRPSVREALRVLESNDLIRSRPGDPSGPEVLPFSTNTLARSMSRLVKVDGIGMGDLVQFRMLLDGAATLLAARLATNEEVAEISRCVQRMEASVDAGYEVFSQADVEFHAAVARASRSSLIQVCNDVVRGVVLGLIADKLANAPDQRLLMITSLGHHKEVLEAMSARNGQKAAALSRKNLHAYYAEYVPETERDLVDALLDDVEQGQAPRRSHPNPSG